MATKSRKFDGIWPPPVYVAIFADGQIVRMSYGYSAKAKTPPFEAARAYVCDVIGGERAGIIREQQREALLAHTVEDRRNSLLVALLAHKRQPWRLVRVPDEQRTTQQRARDMRLVGMRGTVHQRGLWKGFRRRNMSRQLTLLLVISSSNPPARSSRTRSLCQSRRLPKPRQRPTRQSNANARPNQPARRRRTSPYCSARSDHCVTCWPWSNLAPNLISAFPDDIAIARELADHRITAGVAI